MILKVSNLGKRFNKEWIFRCVDFQFTTGNTYAILGPNGSGKSTLMKILWGQEPQSEGSITYSIEGKTITPEEVYRYVSIVTPYMDLMEEFTLEEQIDFHFKFKSGTLNSTQLIIENLELTKATNKPIKQFSSGMKQRLKLGLAFFSDSKAIFLDEPTTNLDSHAIDWYRRNLMEIASEKLVFIATNQDVDYPAGSIILELSAYKKVTNPIK